MTEISPSQSQINHGRIQAFLEGEEGLESEEGLYAEEGLEGEDYERKNGEFGDVDDVPARPTAGDVDDVPARPTALGAVAGLNLNEGPLRVNANLAAAACASSLEGGGGAGGSGSGSGSGTAGRYQVQGEDGSIEWKL